MSLSETLDAPEVTITTNEVPEQKPMRASVETALRNYFAQLEGQPPSELYDMVLAEVEEPLLRIVMEYTRGNQSKAAIILGLSRGTLRKKLKIYDIN